jgi:DNA (cytosine-5)-methyltransferase 1
MGAIRLLDLFCGIGGFHLGFTQAAARLGVDLTVVGAADKNESCRAVYEHNHGLRPIGDLAAVSPADLPEHDILTAGAPCQPWSEANTRRNSEDDSRALLFWTIVQTARFHRPSVVLLENVPGFLDEVARVGSIPARVVRSLRGIGYSVAGRILSPTDLGMPQRRKRSFILATLDTESSAKKIIEAIETVDRSDPVETLLDLNVSREFRCEQLWERRRASGESVLPLLMHDRHKRLNEVPTGTQSPHLLAALPDCRQEFRIYSTQAAAPTLIASHTPAIETRRRVWRLLTVRESLRLQGFPENFVPANTFATAVRQVENAVHVSVVEEIASSILSMLFSDKGLHDTVRSNPWRQREDMALDLNNKEAVTAVWREVDALKSVDERRKVYERVGYSIQRLARVFKDHGLAKLSDATPGTTPRVKRAASPQKSKQSVSMPKKSKASPGPKPTKKSTQIVPKVKATPTHRLSPEAKEKAINLMTEMMGMLRKVLED